MRFIKKYLFVFFALSILQSGLAFAGSQGHYYPGIINIRDVVVPPKGFYYSVYNPYLWSDTYKDRNGDKIENITKTVAGTESLNIGHGRPLDITLSAALNAEIKTDFDAFTSQHTLIWVSDHQILGADYAAYIAPSFGYVHVKATADITGTGTASVGPVTESVSGSRHIEFDQDKDGFGDLLVQPLWLGWHGKEYDASLGYAFFAPTGAYDSEDVVNVGMGYWTHQAQASFVYYPEILAPKATALMVNGTYGYHTEIDGFDLTPGQTIDLEYGLSQYLHPQIEVGVSGYHHWQVTDDSGADAASDSVQDQTNGLAAQISVWPVVNKFYISFRYAWEYESTDRFESNIVTGNAVYIF